MSEKKVEKEKSVWYKTWWGVLIVIFLILPFFLIWQIWAKTKWNKGIKIALTIVIALFYIGIVSIGGTDTSTTNTAKSPTISPEATKSGAEASSPATSSETKKEETKSVTEINYQIIHTAKIRSDGGTNYYALIDSVDLANNSFKDNIKNLVNRIVKDKGAKVSIEIHDSKDSLELSYKQYGDMSLGRPRTQEENNLGATHFIASFDGELTEGIYKNTLTFFPGAFKDNATVGQYVESIEYNPPK